MADKKKMYNGLDIGKFLCAFLILFYHYFSEHGSLPGVLDELLSIYAVAVALFMTISGFLTFSKLEAVDSFNGRWAIVKKQAIRILKIYALWSIPYLLFTVYSWDLNSIDYTFVVWKIQEWVFKSTFYTIWFMPALAFGLVFTFLMVEKLPINVVIIFAVAMYAAGSLGMTYSFFGHMIPGFDALATFSNTWLGGSRGWLFYAFPLLLLGRSAALWKSRPGWLASGFLACACCGLMFVEALLLRSVAGHTGIDMAVLMIPTVLFTLCFLLDVHPPAKSYYVWMRNMSTVIFMSQRLFLTVAPALLPTLFAVLFDMYYLGVVVVCGSVVLFSMGIVGGARKWPILKNLF